MREFVLIWNKNEFDPHDIDDGNHTAPVLQMGVNSMITEETLGEYYNQLAQIYEKALNDVEWQLRQLSANRVEISLR